MTTGQWIYTGIGVWLIATLVIVMFFMWRGSIDEQVKRESS